MDTLKSISVTDYKIQLDLANKLAHDKCYVNDIVYTLLDFVISNKRLFLDYVIEQNYIKLLNCFIEFLQFSLTFSDLKRCVDENKKELYDILSKYYDKLTIHQTIILDDQERFLKLITTKSPDIVNYGEYAKISVLHERLFMLEVILTSIRLDIDLIEELYNSTNNEVIKNMILTNDPDFATKIIIKDANLANERDNLEVVKLMPFSDQKETILPKVLRQETNEDQEEFVQSELLVTTKYIRKERPNFPVYCDQLLDMTINSIKEKNHDVFYQMYTLDYIRKHKNILLVAAKEFKNDYAVKLMSVDYLSYFTNVLDAVDKNIIEAFNENNEHVVKANLLKCRFDTLENLFHRCFDEGKMSFLSILLKNKISEVWKLKE